MELQLSHRCPSQMTVMTMTADNDNDFHGHSGVRSSPSVNTLHVVKEGGSWALEGADKGLVPELL